MFVGEAVGCLGWWWNFALAFCVAFAVLHADKLHLNLGQIELNRRRRDSRHVAMKSTIGSRGDVERREAIRCNSIFKRAEATAKIA